MAGTAAQWWGRKATAVATRRRTSPRWQSFLVEALLRVAGDSWSTESMMRFETVLRPLLGQPMTARAWHRMTFNDKVTYRRLKVRDERFVRFSDKLLMREYVTERLGPGCVPRVLAVASSVEEFEDLVGPYVLKPNHGSGWVAFVEPGEKLAPDQVREARRWLARDYSKEARSWGNLGARRLLLAEERLPGPPPDYKLFAFGGRVGMLTVDFDRFTDHRRALMLPDWTRLPGTLHYSPASEHELDNHPIWTR